MTWWERRRAFARTYRSSLGGRRMALLLLCWGTAIVVGIKATERLPTSNLSLVLTAGVALAITAAVTYDTHRRWKQRVDD